MQDVVARPWDAATPAGVSETEHFKSLGITMVMLYFSTGMKGVYLVHPMIASLFAVIDPLRFGGYRWKGDASKPQLAGLLGGIEIWVEASVGNEILITDGPEDLQPRAKIELNNFDFGVPSHPLDRMAGIRT